MLLGEVTNDGKIDQLQVKGYDSAQIESEKFPKSNENQIQ